MRLISITYLSFTLGLILCNSGKSKIAPSPVAKSHKASAFNFRVDSSAKKLSQKKALRYADSIKNYLRRNGYSTRLLFVADMNLHMYLKRFYVIHPDSSKILKSFLVAHGQGKGSKWDSAVFSNISGSLCSSKGKYKIGISYIGDYGKGYKLHGLDITNNNALKRLIVFHSYVTQTDREYTNPNYMSSGCPMLAPRSFAHCDTLIQKEKKPVMMVVY